MTITKWYNGGFIDCEFCSSKKVEEIFSIFDDSLDLENICSKCLLKEIEKGIDDEEIDENDYKKEIKFLEERVKKNDNKK